MKRKKKETKIERIKKIVDDYFDNTRYYSGSDDLAPLWAQRNMQSIKDIIDEESK